MQKICCLALKTHSWFRIKPSVAATHKASEYRLQPFPDALEACILGVEWSRQRPRPHTASRSDGMQSLYGRPGTDWHVAMVHGAIRWHGVHAIGQQVVREEGSVRESYVTASAWGSQRMYYI